MCGNIIEMDNLGIAPDGYAARIGNANENEYHQEDEQMAGGESGDKLRNGVVGIYIGEQL